MISYTLLMVFALVISAYTQTYTVTNTNDSGHGSLRWALEQANARRNVRDNIIFNISGSAPPFVIQPLSNLPEITDLVVISGYSQPGSFPASDSSPANIYIVLDGSRAEPWNRGLAISADNCVISGLVICNFPEAGIFIENGRYSNIQGCYIGLDHTGTVPQPNGGMGIWMKNSWSNTIGGSSASTRNVISGNAQDGIELSGPGGNRVAGNYIGTDASGRRYIPNGVPSGGTDLRINDSPNNIIGGSNASYRNVISGICITNSGAISNRIEGNYINVDVTGTRGLMGDGNCGVYMLECSNNSIGPGNFIGGCMNAGIYLGSGNRQVYCSNNIIYGNYIGGGGPGGSVPNRIGIKVSEYSENNKIRENVITNNMSHGIVINTNFDDSNPYNHGTAIFNNSIYNNGGLAIDLGADGVTQNDQFDFDIGPNNLINFPVIESVKLKKNMVRVRGSYDCLSTPGASSNLCIEFYSNSSPDESGYGEAETCLGRMLVQTVGHFEMDLPILPLGTWISTTMTDFGCNSTSEFSKCVQVTAKKNKALKKSTDEVAALPLEFALKQNYPNPFNPTTLIEYQLPEESHIAMTVYDINGKNILTLINQIETAGVHTARWDGIDDSGNPVSSGVYLLRINAGTFNQVRKMTLAR